MEGSRNKFSVFLLLCVWNVLAGLSNAHAGHSHSSHSGQMIVTKQSFVQIPENKDSNKCMALLRRTIVRKELMTYPCFHPVPGVVPVVAHQTQMGLVCRGYVNSPSTQYIRIPTCCPGFQPDHHGTCVKAPGKIQITKSPEQKKEQPHHHSHHTPRRLEELTKYPASYDDKRKEVLRKVMTKPHNFQPHPMIMRRIDAIMKQREQFIRQMKHDMDKQAEHKAPPTVAVGDLFPSIPHPLLGQQKEQAAPEIPRPSEQAGGQGHHHMHHPESHGQMSADFHASLHQNNVPHTHDDKGNPQINLHDLKPNEAFLREREFQRQQLEARRQMQVSRQQQINLLQMQRQRAIAMRQHMLHQRRIQQAEQHRQQLLEEMRNAAQQNFRQMPQIPSPQQPVQPFVIQRTYTSDNERFPNVPQMRASLMLAVSPNSIQHIIQKSFSSFPQIPTPPVARYQVQLPRIPVESPPVSISPGPNSPFNGPAPTCFAQYMMVLKKCFHGAGIDIPIDHNMFNVNFNYNGVCEKREMIMSCIFENLGPCSTPQEHNLVKSTIGHTVDEMNRFCQIGQINGIEDRLEGNGDSMAPPMIPDQAVETPVDIGPIHEMPIIPEDHHAMNLGQHTVNIQAVQDPVPEISVVPEVQSHKEEAPAPVEEAKTSNTEDAKEKPTVKISEHEDSEKISSSAHAHSQSVDHDHDAHVSIKELAEDNFYLPILIGTAIGVAGIFILLLAILCVCCRRRLKKKIYIQKESEKPKLFDVYTIGVPPPVYEVNGIPPISYEEAKGEKFSGSPASIRRHNAENESQVQETARTSGVISDI